MGVVYRGLQQQLDRPVAVKVLAGRFTDDAQVEERFRSEARAASQLTNPHTVTVYDFGTTDDGALFLALQLVEGEVLRTRLARGRLPLWVAVTIGSQVCESLAEAHAHRPAIVHRDIKPDNIMVRETGEGEPFAVVLDFGLARFADSARLTATNNIVGTPTYMSPEQARHGGQVDTRADLYSLGVVLYEMIAGRPPFASQDPASLLFMHAYDAPPRLSDALPGVALPEALDRLVSELLAKAPASRPASAVAVRARLLEIWQQLPPDLAPPPTAGASIQQSLSPRPSRPPAPTLAQSPSLDGPPPETKGVEVARPVARTPLSAIGADPDLSSLTRRRRWPAVVAVLIVAAVVALFGYA